MNFQDLLDEVEDAMKSPRSGGEGHAAGMKYTNDADISTRITQPVSKGRGRNELDDLLEMLNDEDSKPAAVHPQPMSSTRAGAYNSSNAKISRTEFQAGGTKKCPQVLIDGGRANRGLTTAFSSRNVCSNLRCNECDFTVVQFPGKKWDATADYMFFRENVPNEARLRVKMESDPDFAAYACQCKWLSICSQTRADQCQVKWSCAGH